MKFPADRQHEILQIIEKHPSGISIENLLNQTKFQGHLRTFQRLLSVMIKSGSITRVGRGPLTKYLVKPKNLTVGKDEIALSPEAQSIKEYVNQSIISRKPVGYQREFLEDYEPNHTFYLSSEMREELKQIGTPPDGKQPAGTFARQIYNRLLIDLSWNSSRLEGNTYSLLETERLLAFGETIEGKSSTETQMILNHKAAIEFLVENISEISFNGFSIRNLHALLSDNLLSDPNDCGQLRRIPVGIGGNVYIPPEVPFLVEEFLGTILNKTTKIIDPFEQAFFMMVHIPYLQPFVDVNKRVSRLAANIPLMKKNLCPLSFIDVPEKYYIGGTLGIYELNRIELLRDVFVWAYRRSTQRYFALSQTLGEPDPFRLKYRQMIKQIVSEVVKSGQNKEKALKYVQTWTKSHLPQTDQIVFVTTVEQELHSLHLGNIARYKITTSEFKAWERIWIEKKKS